MRKTVDTNTMINYLQQMMNKVKEREAWCKPDDEILMERIDAMIACKEMVEALIEAPVNLQLDGKVTIGF